MGGEKRNLIYTLRCPLGSPPRGRGKACHVLDALHSLRITPAWAGKSIRKRAWRSQAGDHPRVGGEKFPVLTLLPWLKGSPPRGRGKVYSMMHSSISIRITPAWAGKSFYGSLICCVAQDHPRVGGEKSNLHILAVSRLGSPPRGRGKAGRPAGCSGGSGITPAWAGKR